MMIAHIKTAVGGGDWAASWVATYPESVLAQEAAPICALDCCIHSQGLNCVLKSRAARWLWAKLAGWDGSPLPVQMTSFTASVQGMSTELRWSTAIEINNYGFNIERRKIGIEWTGTNIWEKIGFVSGFGTSNSPHKYSYSDSRLEAGHYLYRLKQIDNDAKFEYSQSVEVEVSVVPHEFNVSQNYPNPFNPST